MGKPTITAPQCAYDFHLLTRKFTVLRAQVKSTHAARYGLRLLHPGQVRHHSTAPAGSRERREGGSNDPFVHYYYIGDGWPRAERQLRQVLLRPVRCF